MKQIFAFLFSFLLFWFFGFIPKARAQSVGLSVSPPVIEVLIAPGKKVTQTFNLQALGKNLFTDKTGVTVTPELHLIKSGDNSGHVTLDPTPINLENLDLTITSTPPLNVPFTIPSPSSPAGRSLLAFSITLEAAYTDIPQDVYLALVFRASPSSTTDDLRSTITTPAISALILTTINPTSSMPIELTIKDFESPKVHDSWTPLTITPTLTNNTSTMIRPEGTYEIISPSGKTILSLPLYPNLILGNSSRTILLKPKDENLSPVPPTWSPTWRSLGPHTLRLTIKTGGGNTLTQIDKIIWIFPIRLTFIIVITLLVLISLLTFFFKRSKFNTV